MQQDMTHERTELWMCFLLDYDVFVQLSQNQLFSIHLKSFRALVSIVLNNLPLLPICSKVVGNSLNT